MRTIKLRGIRDYLKVKSNSTLKKQNNIPMFYHFRDIYSPFTVIFGSIILFIIPALGFRLGIVLILSLTIFLAYLYWYARTLAKGIFLTRTINAEKLVEDDTISISYKVHNASPFEAVNISIHDSFGPSQDPQISENSLLPIPPHKYIKTLVEKRCDGGMGKHTIGPLIAKVTDPLGIFELTVTEDDQLERMTFPSVGRINSVSSKGSSMSNNFGFRAVPRSGNNINFTSLRPYVQGDAFKHIAWKASAKSPELLVKEFERSVNSSVTFALNLDPNIHLGHKSTSTWEVCRDACLSLIRQEIANHNSVQLLSQNIAIPIGRGMSHFSTMSNHLCNLNIYDELVGVGTASIPEKLEGLKPQKHFLHKNFPLIPKYSTLIYITPYHFSEIDKIKQVLSLYVQEQVQVICIFIDPVNLLIRLKDILPIEKFPIEVEPLSKTIEHIQKLGIACYTIESKIESVQIDDPSSLPDHSYYIKAAAT